MAEDRLKKYAELAVRVGANVGEGQYVLVMGLVEHAPLVREVTNAAYSAGAEFVDVWYTDQHVRRAMIGKGKDSSLESRRSGRCAVSPSSANGTAR